MVGPVNSSFNEHLTGGYWLDTKCDAIERKLSDYAYYPVVGVAPAGAKILFGIAQVVGGAALTVLILVGSIFSSECRKSIVWSACFIVHGTGNIGVGFLEGIPFIGYGMWHTRQRHVMAAKQEWLKANDRGQDKPVIFEVTKENLQAVSRNGSHSWLLGQWVPYLERFREGDIIFLGLDPAKEKTYNSSLKGAIAMAKGEMTFERKDKIAKQIFVGNGSIAENDILLSETWYDNFEL